MTLDSDLLDHVRTAIRVGFFDEAENVLMSKSAQDWPAAVRLNLVGPREAQRIQAELGHERGRWLDVALATSVEEACQTSPVLEMLQAQHGRLYSKLFVS